MYGPASVPNQQQQHSQQQQQSKTIPGRGERRTTPRGHMSGGANQRPPLADLPPNMKMMFEPRPPLEYKPPLIKTKMPPYSGVGNLLNEFELVTPPIVPVELPKDRKLKVREQLLSANAEKNELLVADWDPHHNINATENAYHTLFVARLAYETTEKKLKREFEQYGPIKTVKIIHDLDGKPQGYAFIEFEREEDMTSAYKRADGKKIDGRRIIVDVERGRTVRDWRPRRFGGGLGGRKAKKSKKQIAEDEIRTLAARGLAQAPPPDRRAYDRPGDRGGDRNDRDRGDRGSERYGSRNNNNSVGGGGSSGSSGNPTGDRSGLGYRGNDRDYNSNYGGNGSGPSSGSGSGSNYQNDRKRPRSRSREREREREREKDRDRERDREKERDRDRDRDRDRHNSSSGGNYSRGSDYSRDSGNNSRNSSSYSHSNTEPEGGRYERRRRSKSPNTNDRGRY